MIKRKKELDISQEKYYIVHMKDTADGRLYTTLCNGEREVEWLLKNMDRNLYALIKVELQENYRKHHNDFCNNDDNLEKGRKL